MSFLLVTRTLNSQACLFCTVPSRRLADLRTLCVLTDSKMAMPFLPTANNVCGLYPFSPERETCCRLYVRATFAFLSFHLRTASRSLAHHHLLFFLVTRLLNSLICLFLSACRLALQICPLKSQFSPLKSDFFYTPTYPQDEGFPAFRSFQSFQ